MQEREPDIHTEPEGRWAKMLSIVADKSGMSLRCLLGWHSFRLLDRGGSKRATVECCRCRRRLRLPSYAHAGHKQTEGYRKL